MESMKHVLMRSGKIYPYFTWIISSVIMLQLFIKFCLVSIIINKMKLVQKPFSACAHLCVHPYADVWVHQDSSMSQRVRAPPARDVS